MHPPKVIPMSARPDELRAFLAMQSGGEEDTAYQAAAHRVGISGWGLDTENARYGSVFDFSDFTDLLGDFDTDLTRYDKLGYRKYSNWKQIATSLGIPSIFLGDNGQGDAVAAQMMLKRSSGLRDS